MAVKLIEFTDVLEQDYLSYIEEWEKSKEKIIPSATNRNNFNFDQLQQKWSEEQTDKMFELGFVPATLYFLVNENGRVLGAIHLRHVLNERLLQNGGHIGYGVRPSERGRGYASIMLNMLLNKLRDKDYTKVLLTCDDDNISSYKTIESNNGVLENKVEFEGELTRRYWINL